MVMVWPIVVRGFLRACILITGATEAKNLNNLHDVLSCLEQAGTNLNKNKYVLFFPR